SRPWSSTTSLPAPSPATGRFSPTPRQASSGWSAATSTIAWCPPGPLRPRRRAVMAGKVRHTIGEELEETHEINVTPFIDVMLVLLIIFMVAAPLATVDVNVDLPGSTAAATPRPDKPAFLTLKRDLTLTLGNDTLPRQGFTRALDRITEADKETRIFLRA